MEIYDKLKHSTMDTVTMDATSIGNNQKAFVLDRRC